MLALWRASSRKAAVLRAIGFALRQFGAPERFSLAFRRPASATCVGFRNEGQGMAARRPAAPPLQGNLRHRRASRCLFGDLRDKNELSPECPIAGLTPGRLLLSFCGALQKSALLCLGQDSVFRFCHLAGIEPREGTTALGCRLRRAEPDVPRRDRGWIAACSWV